MSTGKYIFKVLTSHIIAAAVMTFMMITLILIFQEQMWYQVSISFVLAGFYWFFMCYSLEKYALYDVKNGTFKPIKIIIAAAALNIPNILFIILDQLAAGNDIYKLFFRYWNSGYLNFIILLNDGLWLRLLISALYFPGLMFAYYRGVLIKKKTESIIEKMKEEANGKRKAVDLPPDSKDEF